MSWRQGRKAGHHIYEQAGPEPSDQDRWLGSFVDPYDAECAVAAMRSADRLLGIDRDLTELMDLWRSRSRRTTDPEVAELLNKLATRFDEIDRELSR